MSEVVITRRGEGRMLLAYGKNGYRFAEDLTAEEAKRLLWLVEPDDDEEAEFHGTAEAIEHLKTVAGLA